MKPVYRIFKIVITLGLLIFLLIKIDLIEALTLFSKLDVQAIGAIFFMSFLLIFVSVLKWQVFLDSFNLSYSFWRLYNFYVVGYFFNNFFPSNIGGDTVRVALTAQGKGSYTFSFVAVFMERFTGIFATLLFASFSLPLLIVNFNVAGNMALVLLPGITFFVIMMGILFIQPEHFDIYIPSTVFIQKVQKKFKDVWTLIYSFRDQKKVLLKAMFLSVIFNFFGILNVYVVIYVLGFEINIFDLFVFVPLIFLISTIPISINAIGVAEGAYVYFLGLSGFSGPEALAVALLLRAKIFAVSLFGGFLFLGYKNREGFKRTR